MHRHTLRAICTAVALLLAVSFTPPAAAVTLMVNGDTPAQHWQRIADATDVPTYDGVVDLYSAPCPGHGDDALACFEAPAQLGARPRIYLLPGVHIGSFAFRHELGHAYAWQHGGDQSERAANTYALCGSRLRITKLTVTYWIGWDVTVRRVRATCARLSGSGI